MASDNMGTSFNKVPKIPQRLLDINVAAHYLGVKPMALRMRIHRGFLKQAIVRVGTRIYLDKIEIDKWIETEKGGVK